MGRIEGQQASEAATEERLVREDSDRSADATGVADGVCPSCGRLAGPGARFCGVCRSELRVVSPGDTELAYAGFWLRLLAALIDLAILFVVCVVAATLPPTVLTAFLAQLLVISIYVIGFWVGQGATPGKMAVGVKVVMANGLPIEFGAACLRYFGYFVCALTLAIGYLMIAFTAEKRGLQDYIAGTVVVKKR
jgi:uncharacterized RDD family membrane protein YckC